MASTEGLVPITRSYLASYYENYPFTPLPSTVSSLSSSLRSMSSDLYKDLPLTDAETLIVHESDSSPPKKMDENMWKNREHIEEIVCLLEKSRWPSRIQRATEREEVELGEVLERIRVRFQGVLKVLEEFQSKNSEHIFNTVMTYMPQDFRGTIIKQQRERSERNKQAEIDALVNSGGSIHDRYTMLWKQQMERRRQLAQLGSATGVYKTLVKYLVGVPEVLLDFIRQINDDDGLKDEVAVLQQAAEVYTSEFERFIKFISEIFANSPFFISAEEAGALEGRKNDEYKEITIPAGKTHEVSLTVESINSYIAWDFSLGQGKVDIGFSMEYSNSAGGKTLILPYRRYESDQGNFCTCLAGNYKLIWDNSYSTFYKKVLRYKVDCIPPA